MSRFVDLLLVLIGLVMILVVHTGSAPVMEELRDHAVTEDNPSDDIDATNIANEMHEAVTKWVPTVAAVGLWVVAGFREYRRQRVTALRGRRF